MSGIVDLFHFGKALGYLDRSKIVVASDKKQSKIDRKFRNCDCCKELFEVTPFVNMRGDGVNLYTRIEIYEEEFDLCPKCTLKILKYIESDKKECGGI